MGTFQVRSLGYALGAEIRGVDLTQRLDPKMISEIRKIWLERIVLRIPGQDLTPEQMLAFCERFGQIDDNRHTPRLRDPKHDAVFILVNKPFEVNGKTYGGNISNDWHSDLSHTVRPATGTFLNAKILPDVGGDTMFANMYMAYDTLSPGLKQMVDSLIGVHDVRLSSGFRSLSQDDVKAEMARVNPLVSHPVVKVHPETGRKALYVGHRVRYFAGMSEDESRPLIGYLNAHATRCEFIYRHSWMANDLLFWDNRCSLHYAVGDFDRRQLRRMQRCSLLGPQTGEPD